MKKQVHGILCESLVEEAVVKLIYEYRCAETDEGDYRAEVLENLLMDFWERKYVDTHNHTHLARLQ